jgi:hypothetical protein
MLPTMPRNVNEASNKSCIDKTATNIFSKQLNASNLTNAIWQTLCELTGILSLKIVFQTKK